VALVTLFLYSVDVVVFDQLIIWDGRKWPHAFSLCFATS